MSALRVRDLVDLAQHDYEVNQRPYAKVFPSQMRRLLEALGDLPAALTFQRLERYKADRIASGAARDTVNKELGGLSKGYRIAVDARLLAPGDVPVIRRLAPGAPRRGFFEPDDFRRVAAELPPDVRDVAEFAYWTGWRLGETLGLQWDTVSDYWCWTVDKNGHEKRTPLNGHAGAVLERRRKKRCCEWVFHRRGRRIRSVRKAWNSACDAAGFPGRIFHDLRRSFVKTALSAGLDRATVMALSGHRSHAVFSRYNVQRDDDLLDASRRLGLL